MIESKGENKQSGTTDILKQLLEGCPPGVLYESILESLDEETLKAAMARNKLKKPEARILTLTGRLPQGRSPTLSNGGEQDNIGKRTNSPKR